jgi:hypothetical protein
VIFDTANTDLVFYDGPPIPDTYLWHGETANFDRATGGTLGEGGVTAMVLFDYDALSKLPQTDAPRDAYLRANAQYLPVNMFTGQLFPRGR